MTPESVSRSILYVASASALVVQIGMSVWSSLRAGHWDGAAFALSFSSTIAPVTAVIMAHDGRLGPALRSMIGRADVSNAGGTGN